MTGMRLFQFARLESRLENFVEGLFAGRVKIESLLPVVARVFDEHVRFDTAGNRLIPARFMVRLHPEDYLLLMQDTPNAATLIQHYIGSLAGQVNQAVNVIFQPDEQQSRGSIQVEIAWPTEKNSQTVPLHAVSVTESDAPFGAQLLREGKKVMALDRPVINIGRRLDNHLVLEDGRVSRLHCQIRLRHGQYVVYDLNSSYGTSVNDVPVVEHVLKTGDVLSIGGVCLIYVDDTPTDALDSTRQDTAIHPPVGMFSPDEDALEG